MGRTVGTEIDVAAWLDPAALASIAAAAGVVLLPGLAVGLALRLRGLVLLGAAPLASVALVAVSAILAGAAGVRWSPLAPALATAATVVAVLLGRALAHLVSRGAPKGHGRGGAALTAVAGLLSGGASAHLVAHEPASQRARHRAQPPPVGRWGWPLAGAAVGAGALAAQVLTAVRTPSTISQAYDVVFHVNALAWIEATGDASSLHLRRVLGGGADGFYPGAWHGVASLVAEVSGAGPVVVTNALALVVAAGIWPLSVVLLVDRVTASPARAAVAGVLAGALPAAPVLLLDWGVLYPVLLTMALVPAILALLVALVAPRGADRPPTGVLMLLIGTGSVAAVAAHPSGAFTLVVLGAPLLAWAGASALRRTWTRREARLRAGLCAAAALVLAALAAGAVLASPTLAAVAAYRWPTTTRVPEAALDALLGAPPDGRAGNVLAAVAVVLGAVTVHGLRPGRRSSRGRRGGPGVRSGRGAGSGAGWLVVAWLVTGALYVVAQTTTSNALTGPWYNDAYRLAPIVAVPALVLAAHGVVTVVEAVASLLGVRLAAAPLSPRAGSVDGGGRGRRAAAPEPRALGPLVPAGAGTLVVGLLAGALAVAVVVAPGSGRERTTESLAAAYRQGPGGDAPLLSKDEELLFERAAAIVPPGTVIANDPFDGSGLSYALAGLDPLFRHMGSEWTPAGAVVKDDLARVGTDPAVCAAVKAENVGYLLALGPRYLDFVPRAKFFERVQDAADTPAFEEVAHVGDARLLRLVRCGGEPVAPPR